MHGCRPFRIDEALGRAADGRRKVDAMVALAGLTRKGFAVGDLSLLMSPRTVITWAENIAIFHDLKQAFELSFLNKCEPAEHAIVSEYFQRCIAQELMQPAEPALAFLA